MEDEITCSSCKIHITNVEGSTQFSCPKCGKCDIVRCKHCRDSAVRYTCPQCGFSGPN